MNGFFYRFAANIGFGLASIAVVIGWGYLGICFTALFDPSCTAIWSWEKPAWLCNISIHPFFSLAVYVIVSFAALKAMAEGESQGGTE